VTNEEAASAPKREFTFTLLPDASRLSIFRCALSDWLREHAIEPALRTDLLIAAHEAVANAIEHAGSRSEIQIRATLEAGSIEIEVHDEGTWKHPTTTRADERGRGLALIAALVSESDLVHNGHGTTLRMSQIIPNH
jgi:anti-sigma regulatory factor (Ser/Thr protein kinase)